MNKKKIILFALIGLIGFGAMFVLGWFTTRPSDTTQTADTVKADESTSDSIDEYVELQPPTVDPDGETKKSMTLKQLRTLVYEVREKIKLYDQKLERLKIHEERLKSSETMLNEDMEKLENMRIELASTLDRLTSEHAKLEQSKVEIAHTERRNLMAVAATYDKMDSASASKILANMSQSSDVSASDAVKILYYMGDRQKAKVLAEMSNAEPALAAYFCQKMKKIVEH